MTVDTPLEDLLDRMTLALQRGALADLGPLCAAIEGQLAALTAVDAGRAEGLHRRARRNDSCLRAAARGVRAAIARISDIGGAGPNLSTYSADGRKFRVAADLAQHTQRL
jgi:hypothetical protein